MPRSGHIRKKSLPRVVVDTNVLISGLLTPDSPSGRILSLVTEPNTFTLVISQEIFVEYAEVASRRKFQFSKPKLEKAMRLIVEHSLNVSPCYSLDVAVEPTDNKFLECALEGNASFLVTENRKHFPFTRFRGVKILSPSEFLSFFEKTQ